MRADVGDAAGGAANGKGAPEAGPGPRPTTESAGADGRGVVQADPAAMVELARARMPFGRYKGTRLVDLPEPYVVWFFQKGVPRGKLGDQMRCVYEIKLNGLEHLFDPWREEGGQ